MNGGAARRDVPKGVDVPEGVDVPAGGGTRGCTLKFTQKLRFCRDFCVFFFALRFFCCRFSADFVFLVYISFISAKNLLVFLIFSFLSIFLVCDYAENHEKS